MKDKELSFWISRKNEKEKILSELPTSHFLRETLETSVAFCVKTIKELENENSP
jgi:hypothetical protein